ncbi:MAG: hypothetical protein HY906_23325 [Deltaproteobacteria bacterium]|nr:hypothetical protein [Deltaproteobacteria bacterium]
MPDDGRRSLLERVRDFSARLDRRRTATSYLVFSVLFLSAALLWTRLPSGRPWVRHLWAAGLLTLAVRDFALGLRRISRERELPDWTWIVSTVAYGVLGTLAALLLIWTRT